MRNRDLRELRKQKQERVHSSEDRPYLDLQPIYDAMSELPFISHEMSMEVIWGPNWREMEQQHES